MGPRSYQLRIVVLLAEFVIVAEKNAPAATGKASLTLVHVIKFQERHFCRKKSACGRQEDLTKLITCQKTPGR